MFFETVKNVTRSLRFRLVFWNTLLAFLLFLVCLLFVRSGVQMTRYRLMDEFLDEESQGVVDELKAHDGNVALVNARAARHTRQQLFAQLLDADGKVLWSSVQAPEAGLEKVPLRKFAKPMTVGNFYFRQDPLHLPHSNAQFLRVGMSLDHLHREMGMFDQVMLMIGGAFLILAPLKGSLVASRAIRPVANIIAMSKRLTPSKLEERLPLHGTGDELDRLSTTINDLLDRIAADIQTNRELIANAAHELRSPLTAICNSMELALNSDRSTEEYREFLESMLQECDDLGSLVSKLLLLAESDNGAPCSRHEDVRLDRLAEKSLDMFQAVAESKQIELTAPRLEPLAVRGDSQRLLVVINNLLDNAIKYTPPGGKITVELFRKPDAASACFRVADTGIGIPSEAVPLIFQRFFRTDRSRQRTPTAPGHGLGLSICQAFVQAHGGSIEVMSCLERGSTFAVNLPLQDQPAEIAA